MIFSFPPYALDEELFELRRDGQRVPVQPKVLGLLFLLVRERQRTLTKAEVLDAVWPGVSVTEASLARAVSEARKAIEDEEQTAIVTVRGRGFRFATPVTIARPSLQATPEPKSARDLATRLVGREAALAVLSSRLSEASRGRGGVVWVTGEVGIGRTSALDAFASSARSAQVLRASASGETLPPLWPFTQLARAAGDATLEERVDALRRAGDGADARFAASDAVVRALLALPPPRPLALLFDDLEEADAATLELLAFLARETRTSPVLIVLALREGAASRAPDALRALLRDHGDVVVPLRRLDASEVTVMVRAITGVAPDRLVSAVVEKSGGNPMLVRRVLATEWAAAAIRSADAELEGSVDIQPELFASIGRHLEGLSPSSTQVLLSASLLGRSFTFPALLAVTGLAPDELLARLDESIRGKLVVRDKSGSYRFVHVLVRDVLSKRLPAHERAERHRMVGHALLGVYGDSALLHAAELAPHFLRSAELGEAPRAVELSLRAAEQALAQGDRARAAQHYKGACDALAYLPNETETLARTRIALADVQVKLGQIERARAAYLDGAWLGRALGNAHLQARAAAGHAGVTPPSPERDELVKQAIEALGAAKDEESTRLRELLEKRLQAE